MEQTKPPTQPTHTAKDVLAAGRSVNGVRVGEVSLAVGETASNPASTKDVIYGPAFVQYIEWPDGGIEARVRER